MSKQLEEPISDDSLVDDIHYKIYKCNEKLNEHRQELNTTEKCVKENEKRILLQAEASSHNLNLIKDQVNAFYNNQTTILQQTQTIEKQGLQIAINDANIQEQIAKKTILEQNINIYSAKLQEQVTKSTIYEQQIAVYSTKIQEQITQLAVLQQQVTFYSAKLQEQMSQVSGLEQQIQYNNQILSAFYANFVPYSE
jgi:uncharacterized coiled-coil DUF342 family protein